VYTFFTLHSTLFSILFQNIQASSTAVQEANRGGYYQGFDIPPPTRPAIDNIPHQANPASTPFSPTSTSPPRTPITATSTTVFATPAIPLQRFSIPPSHSVSRSPSPPRFSYRRPPPPESSLFSVWDVALLPVTIPFAVTRVMVSFSFRAFAFGVVCGVTLVRLGAQSVQHLILGRRV